MQPIRLISVVCILLAISTPLYAASGTTTPTDLSGVANGLKRILKLDTNIREATGDISKIQKNRARLLEQQKKYITMDSPWNYIPTTDRTLSYILTIQKYTLSCEINAMKSVFTALGKPRTEDDILATLPQYRHPYDTVHGIWGDPDKEFVGLYDGSESKKTGYGIYESGIAAYFGSEFGSGIQLEAWNDATRPADMTDSEHLSHLLSVLDRGGHVILWGDWCTDPRFEDGLLKRDKNLVTRLFPLSSANTCKSFAMNRHFSWKTQEGKMVPAYNGDHVFLLLGYIGKIHSPSHIIVWDTDTGRHIYPTTEWLRKWNELQHRSLTIQK